MSKSSISCGFIADEKGVTSDHKMVNLYHGHGRKGIPSLVVGGAKHGRTSRSFGQTSTDGVLTQRTSSGWESALICVFTTPWAVGSERARTFTLSGIEFK
jgi:hypothetical protein